MTDTQLMSKRQIKRAENMKRIEKRNREREIHSSLPIKFSKNPIPYHDSAMKWWFTIEYDKYNHATPVYLLSVNIDQPTIIYESLIDLFWYYSYSNGCFDSCCDIKIEENSDGIAEKVIFVNMFNDEYIYSTDLKECHVRCHHCHCREPCMSSTAARTTAEVATR